MALQTRRPTGLPSWPCLLIAGAEKAGKSWACAQASSSEKISRTLWVSIGETDPDQYGAIEGANFEIVEHDGTLKGIRNVLWEIASLPAEEKPVLLVVDSMTRLWEMITDQAPAIPFVWDNTTVIGSKDVQLAQSPSTTLVDFAWTSLK